MPDGEDRMAQQHPWTGIAHQGFNPLPHFRFITVNRALIANRFIQPERALFNPLFGILQQIGT